MMRPTRRCVVLYAVGVPLAMIMLILDPALWPLSFDYGILVLLATGCDALLAFPRRRLAVDVSPPRVLHVGEPRDMAVTIAPTGGRPARLEVLAEQSGSLDRPEIRRAEVGADHPARLGLTLTARRRGQVRIDRLWLRWQGPLGLVENVARVPVDATIDVMPNIRGVQRVALQFLSRETIFGIKVQPDRGEGTEFDALRDYAPGLDHRFIDWKHSARHLKLLTREFRTERNHPVILAFDTGYLMCEPLDGIPRLDHAINAGLLLAWISLRHGDLVGTYAFDAAVRQYLEPVRGLPGLGRVQRAAAGLDYRHEETNFTLGLAELNLRLRRRALVILFTDFVDTVTAELMVESLQRVAARHTVLFVSLRDALLQAAIDAPPERFAAVAEAVVAHDLLRERRIVLERLQRLGIQCLDVPSGALSVELINRYLQVKQRGML